MHAYVCVCVCVCLTNGLTLSLGAGHDVDRMSAIGSRSTKLLNYALCIKRGGRGEERGWRRVSKVVLLQDMLRHCGIAMSVNHYLSSHRGAERGKSEEGGHFSVGRQRRSELNA